MRFKYILATISLITAQLCSFAQNKAFQIEIGSVINTPRVNLASWTATNPSDIQVRPNAFSKPELGFYAQIKLQPHKILTHTFRYNTIAIGGSQKLTYIGNSNTLEGRRLTDRSYQTTAHQLNYLMHVNVLKLLAKQEKKASPISEKFTLNIGAGLGLTMVNRNNFTSNQNAEILRYTTSNGQQALLGQTASADGGLIWQIPLEASASYNLNKRFFINAAYTMILPQKYGGNKNLVMIEQWHLAGQNTVYSSRYQTPGTVHSFRLGIGMNLQLGKK
jgi:hypothetical protein